MKLLVDIFGRLFIRTVMLLLVGLALIVMEANKQIQDHIQAEKERITASIEAIDKRINAKRYPFPGAGALSSAAGIRTAGRQGIQKSA